MKSSFRDLELLALPFSRNGVDNNWGDIPKTEADGWIGKEFADVVKEWADKT